MDVTAVEVELHPKARDFLFEHYVTLRRIFSSVLGQVETDYVSIALINQVGQLFFLSSKPAIEQNLIEKDLWPFDASYKTDFIFQDNPKLWSELPYLEHSNTLIKYKQQDHNLITGISIPANYLNYRAVFSYGFKSINPLIQNKSPTQCEKLMAMGKYCLNEIRKTIQLPDEKKNITPRPKLELIINNEVTYEYTPG